MLATIDPIGGPDFNYSGELKPGDKVDIHLGGIWWCRGVEIGRVESDGKTAEFKEPLRSGYASYYGLRRSPLGRWHLRYASRAGVFLPGSNK